MTKDLEIYGRAWAIKNGHLVPMPVKFRKLLGFHWPVTLTPDLRRLMTPKTFFEMMRGPKESKEIDSSSVLLLCKDVKILVRAISSDPGRPYYILSLVG